MEIAINKNRKIGVKVIFSNSFDFPAYGPVIRNSICAVIDTLMAVSTITAIFSSSCKRVILSREKKEAYMIKDIFKDYLLCGEEDGIPPKGFDYGNRPLNFINTDLSNKKIILSTTNGSVSFFKLMECEYVFALSLLNLDYSLNVISNLALKNDKDILLLCSGRKGYSTYEDVYTAGLAIKHLSLLVDAELSDSAKIALEIVDHSGDNVLDVISNSESGQIVRKLGYLDDLAYCSKINQLNTIPRLRVLELNGKKQFKNSTELKDFYDILSKFKNKYLYDEVLFLEPFDNSSKIKI